MQITKKALSKFFITSIIFAIIFTLLRILLLTCNYDFEAGFFTNKLLATWYYIAVIAVAVFFYFIKIKEVKEEKNTLNTVFSIILALLFIVITFFTTEIKNATTPLETIIRYIALISGVMSAVHYIISAFSKNASIICLTNIFPIIFFISKSIAIFMNQSVQANTYNSFADSIALAALSFTLLYEGKALITTAEKRLASMRLISLFAISQAIIPDLIFFIKKAYVLSFSDITLLVVQFVYLLYFVIKIFNNTVSDSEGKI